MIKYYEQRVRSAAWIFRAVPAGLVAGLIQTRWTGNGHIDAIEWPFIVVSSLAWPTAFIAFCVHITFYWLAQVGQGRDESPAVNNTIVLHAWRMTLVRHQRASSIPAQSEIAGAGTAAGPLSRAAALGLLLAFLVLAFVAVEKDIRWLSYSLMLVGAVITLSEMRRYRRRG